MKPNDKAFLALRKKWYSKLADEGFDDIEKVDWGTGEAISLRDNMPRATQPGSTYQTDARRDYFYYLAQWAYKRHHHGDISDFALYLCTDGAGKAYAAVAAEKGWSLEEVRWRRRRLRKWFAEDFRAGYLDDAGYGDTEGAEEVHE